MRLRKPGMPFAESNLTKTKKLTKRQSQLSSVIDIELAKQSVQVTFHRALGEAEELSDRLVA